MSFIVIIGKSVPNSLPDTGLISFGPEEPIQPPMTFGHTTKNLFVSIDFPGPTTFDHHPSFCVIGCLLATY